MNDPHVVALHYRLTHHDTVDYDRANPLAYECPAFSVEVKDGGAVFTMKEHFPTEAEARTVIDPFVEAWRIDVGLRFAPGEFRLDFERAEIVDRVPTQGVIEASAVLGVSIVGHATVHVGRGAYPEPPSGFAVTPAVEAMFSQYEAYRAGRMSLVAVAYFCTTVLVMEYGSERAIKERLSVSGTLLRGVRHLSSSKGGKEARKAVGLKEELTGQEKSWLEAALKALIRRVAEDAAVPGKTHLPLDMGALPPL